MREEAKRNKEDIDDIDVAEMIVLLIKKFNKYQTNPAIMDERITVRIPKPFVEALYEFKKIIEKKYIGSNLLIAHNNDTDINIDIQAAFSRAKRNKEHYKFKVGSRMIAEKLFNVHILSKYGLELAEKIKESGIPKIETRKCRSMLGVEFIEDLERKIKGIIRSYYKHHARHEIKIVVPEQIKAMITDRTKGLLSFNSIYIYCFTRFLMEDGNYVHMNLELGQQIVNSKLIEQYYGLYVEQLHHFIEKELPTMVKQYEHYIEVDYPPEQKEVPEKYIDMAKAVYDLMREEGLSFEEFRMYLKDPETFEHIRRRVISRN